MHQTTLLRVMNTWDRQKNRRVFSGADMRKLFPKDSPRALSMGLRRMLDLGILERPTRGVYVYAGSTKPRTHLLEEVARTLRRGCHNYVSLESALSEYGIISQIPVGNLTVMTTGRRQTFETDYGTIEFTHTDRDLASFIDDLRDVGRPLPMASPDRALTDIRRVGRNTQLVRLPDDDPGETHDGAFDMAPRAEETLDACIL